MHERVFDPGETFIGKAVITVPQNNTIRGCLLPWESQQCGWGQINRRLYSMSPEGRDKAELPQTQLNKAAGQTYFLSFVPNQNFEEKKKKQQQVSQHLVFAASRTVSYKKISDLSLYKNSITSSALQILFQWK